MTQSQILRNSLYKIIIKNGFEQNPNNKFILQQAKSGRGAAKLASKDRNTHYFFIVFMSSVA